MSIRTLSGERFSLTTARAFDDVVAEIERAVGHPKLPELFQSISEAKTPEAVRGLVEAAVGPSGLMEFIRFDFGLMLRKDQPAVQRKALRFLLGNPLVMREMFRSVPDAGSYAPVTILVDERGGGVQLSYDRMESLLAFSDEPHALNVARELDEKVERLLYAAAGQAGDRRAERD